MLLICHFGGKAKRPRSAAAADSSDSDTEEQSIASAMNANAVDGANTNAQRRHSMSASLMSCVRENSPPLDIVDGANCSSATGPMSLPECHMSTMSTTNPQQQHTATPPAKSNVNDSGSSGGNGAGGGGDGSATNTEPKRRRFHPLRNLRRIFRRRTITSVADTPVGVNTLPPPINSTSEKNLRSATLSSISSVVSASSPSSPLTHQQLQDAYSSQSLPKSKSYSVSGGSVVGGVGVAAANIGSAAKSPPHRDALLATVLGGKHKHQQAKQQQQQLQQQLEEIAHDCEMYTTTSSMYHHHQHQQVGSSGGVLFQPPHSVRQSLGVAVLPSAMNRSFYAERQKLRSVGDSSQELDSSGNDSGSANGTNSNNQTVGGSGGSANDGRTNGCAGSEMSDSQRSLSEGRLVDSDYSHDPLSQSHDSVFSESASASIFSNRDYQAELSDVLRKRNRNRQDASEEDLGLPRSPASPQRRADRSQRSHHNASGSSGHFNNQTIAATPSSVTGNQSEVSSLSLMSINSGDGDEMLATSTANNSTISTKEIVQERSMTSSLGGRSITRASTISTTSVASEIYRHSSNGSLGSDSNRDEPDLLGAKCQRLSHSAAKHKMALRPAKKKCPSRQHRRTLETSIPEANEESLRLAGHAQEDISEHDARAKTRSLPPSVNAKILDKHAVDSKKASSPQKSKTKSSVSSNEQIHNVKRSKMEKLEKRSGSSKTTISTSASSSSTSITAATNLFGLRTLTAKATALFEPPQESSTDPTPSEQELKKEKEKEKLKEKDVSNSNVETTESGFLRRLIQRNSKRSVSRSTAINNSPTKNIVAATEDKVGVNQSEHESKSKMQVSTSCLDMKVTPESSLDKLDKSRSALSYEQNIEQTRKDIKREILSVGSTGLNAMLNTHNLTSHNNSTNSIKEAATSPQKPKSGAAARQRYMPQDISSLERNTINSQSSTTTATTASESYASSTSSILSKCSQQEIFQSTSIIREITASQASSVNSMSSIHKSEHHFEKKPKIVGLSAFQQKISRSNDSVGRFASSGNSKSNSVSSLDAVDEALGFKNQEQKQRKIVEKSRSFRTYNEDSFFTAPAVHNNMPSLPDLTLNLRVPFHNDFTLSAKDTATPSPDRSTSLGFEINEQDDVRPITPSTESTGNLVASTYNFSKNVVVKSSPTKLMALSPTKTCTPEHDELEVSNDLLAKSPFINVLRKPTSTTSLEEKPLGVTVHAKKSIEQNNATKKASTISLVAVVPPSTEVTMVEQQQPRPKVLHLRDSNASINTSTSTDDLKLTPTTAAVPLREKLKLPTKVTVGNVRNSVDLLAASPKDAERKSAPTPVVKTNKTQSSKATQRSLSLLDSPPNSQNGNDERNATAKTLEPTSGSSTPNADGVPEFMRIQLNRVDPARIAKSPNVVLAKNVRETHSPPEQQFSPQHQPLPQQQQAQMQPQQQVLKEANERNSNLDDLNLRRLSNESVEIVEKSSPTEVDKQKNVFVLSQSSMNCNNNNRSPLKAHVALTALPPRSPVKKQQSVVASTPTTPNDTEDAVLLRTRMPETPTDQAKLSSNKLSLQERKRLFMSEEKLKTDKRLEELRNERKKSITEEVYRKSFAKSEEKLETSEKAASESVVMLRKKSFCATTQAAAAITNGNRDDATPELMKVFARRSLKIKDEDINALTDKIHANSGGTNSVKKFVSTQQNVDSDKENQSASDEKLDKLPKLETSMESQPHVGGKLTNGISNRNSLADFRTKSVVGSSAAISNGLGLNNSSNNNNNNNNYTAANSNNSTTNGGHTANTINTTTVNANTNGISGCGGGNRSFLPPIKIAGFRTIPIERNNSVSKIYPTTACEALNNNNNNNSNNLNNNNQHHNHSQQHHQQNGKTNERQSLNIKLIESSSSNSAGSSHESSSGSTAHSKTIERSATVSEFKGIHQRRAEWEQRAKEALK